MQRQPVLEGVRLLLRPLAPADWDALFAVGGRKEVWALHPASDRWLEPEFRAFFEDALARGGALAIVDKEDGAIIGSSRYQGHEPVRSCVEIGWTFLAPEYWGGQTNAELKRLMLKHAFDWVDCVEFRVGETNWRSRCAMEKIGGVLTDRETEMAVTNGTVRHVTYEITRAGFYAGPLMASRREISREGSACVAGSGRGRRSPG